METSELSPSSQPPRSKLPKHLTLKTKKLNVSKAKFKPRKVTHERIESLINLYLIHKTILAESPSQSAYRTLHKKCQQEAEEDFDGFEVKVISEVGFSEVESETILSETLNCTSMKMANQQLRMMKNNRSILSDQDINYNNISQDMRNDVSTLSTFKTNPLDDVNWSQRFDLNRAFAKLTLKNSSIERANPFKSVETMNDGRVLDKENFLEPALNNQRRNHNEKTLDETSTQDKTSTISEMFSDISMIQPLEETVYRDQDSTFTPLYDNRKQIAHGALDTTEDSTIITVEKEKKLAKKIDHPLSSTMNNAVVENKRKLRNNIDKTLERTTDTVVKSKRKLRGDVNKTLETTMDETLKEGSAKVVENKRKLRNNMNESLETTKDETLKESSAKVVENKRKLRNNNNETLETTMDETLKESSAKVVENKRRLRNNNNETLETTKDETLKESSAKVVENKRKLRNNNNETLETTKDETLKESSAKVVENKRKLRNNNNETLETTMDETLTESPAKVVENKRKLRNNKNETLETTMDETLTESPAKVVENKRKLRNNNNETFETTMDETLKESPAKVVENKRKLRNKENETLETTMDETLKERSAKVVENDMKLTNNMNESLYTSMDSTVVENKRKLKNNINETLDITMDSSFVEHKSILRINTDRTPDVLGKSVRFREDTIMKSVLESSRQSSLETALLSPIHFRSSIIMDSTGSPNLDSTRNSSSDEEYFSGVEDTIVPAEGSVQSVVERSFKASPDCRVTRTKKIPNQGELLKESPVRVTRSKAITHQVASGSEVNPCPKVTRSKAITNKESSYSSPEENPVSQFNKLKFVTVRRGRKIVMDDPETTVQRSKVSLAPGKMWKRSIINQSTLDRGSHRFSRTLVDYDESMSMMSFRSRSFRRLSNTNENTLYESVISFIQGDPSDNEYCREKILEICGQADIVSFEERYPNGLLKNCKKIGEGVYGEVFKLENSVIKLMPIEGFQTVNGEKQKVFREIYSEIIVTKETSELQYRTENSTPCFTELVKCSCVRGRYPPRLINLWDDFAKTKKSYNDHPSMFGDDQLFMIIELKNGGIDSVDVKYRNPHQTYALILQIIFSLAVAEIELEFEHRDLHMSNILVQESAENEKVPFTLDDICYDIKNMGFRATIIDFTISRCYVGEKICFYDLSEDKELFEGEGDYQFDMYRMMRQECNDNWQNFTPKNNVVWMHYLAKKACDPKTGYRYLRTPRHQAFELLEELEKSVLSYNSCYEMAHAMCSTHSTDFPLLKKAKFICPTKRR